VLLSLTSLLGDQSRLFSRLYTLELNSDQLKVAYGRGLWCALIAVVVALAALYLAGRSFPSLSASAPDEQEDEEEQPVWSWRRPEDDDEEEDEQPFELTVTPTTPFTSRADDHDEPGR
jgi:hypothetical protein